MTYSNLLCAANGFGFQNGSGHRDFEDILHRAHSTGRGFEEVDLSFPLGRCRSSNNTAIRLQSRNPGEIFLQALRDFVSERHGELEEGWRVEFKQSVGSCELYAVYCAPDGKTFDSVYEVARHLGLISKYNSKEPEIKSEGCFSTLERTHLPRKRKARRSGITNGYSENKETSFGGNYMELPSNGLSIQFCANTFDNNAQLTEAAACDSGRLESEKNNVSYMLFLLSLFENMTFFFLSYS